MSKTLVAADREVVSHALEAVRGLGKLDRCRDAEALRSALPWPDGELARLQAGGGDGARQALEQALAVYGAWHLANPSDLAAARAAAKEATPQ